ncbi:MAG: hypothetical protein GX329_07805 [Tissierellia bacterium]|nr:hypothetical protein [Tissierellia bacterium]
MKEIVKMKWPKLEQEVRVELLTDFNPTVCDIFLSQLPFTSIQSHAVVCGKQMYFPYILTNRPEDMQFENMAGQPIGRVNIELDFQYLSLNYGPNYEAVPTLAIGQVLDEDIDILKSVGYSIWNNLLFSKEYIEVIVER